MSKTTERISIRKITFISLLAAISWVLMLLDFPIPIFPTFLKFDLSDIPSLIASFSMGPMVGVVVQLIKNLLHLLVTHTAGVGELANFLIGVALVLPAGMVYKVNRTKSGALIGMLLGTLFTGIVGGLANYFILIPFYAKMMPIESIIAMCAKIIPSIDSLFKVVLLSIVPFNIFKGLIISAITFLLYKKLTPIINWVYKKVGSNKA